MVTCFVSEACHVMCLYAPRCCLDKDISLPAEKVHQLADQLTTHATCLVNHARRLILVADLVDSLKVSQCRRFPQGQSCHHAGNSIGFRQGWGQFHSINSIIHFEQFLLIQFNFPFLLYSFFQFRFLLKSFNCNSSTIWM